MTNDTLTLPDGKSQSAVATSNPAIEGRNLDYCAVCRDKFGIDVDHERETAVLVRFYCPGAKVFPVRIEYSGDGRLPLKRLIVDKVAVEPGAVLVDEADLRVTFLGIPTDDPEEIDTLWQRYPGSRIMYDDPALSIFHGEEARNGTCRTPTPQENANSPMARELERWRKNPDWFITDLNDTYFVSQYGSKVRVFWVSRDEALKRSTLASLSFEDFAKLFSNQIYEVTQPDGKAKHVSLGRAWLDHPNRRQYLKGVYFDPTGDTRPGGYNLWRGFAVEPVAGDWSLLKSHVLTDVAGGDAGHFNYIMNWLAFSVQHPEKPAEVALVLRGPKGIGKSILGGNFTRLFGQHGIQITQSKHLVGHFNKHLHDCVVLYADEALWAGDKSSMGVLNGLITEPTLVIEGKGYDIFTAANRLHIIITGNEEWIVPASADERRYAVFDVSAAHQGDRAYWKAMVDQLEKGGGRAAMLHELLRRDISKFEPRNHPHTQALAKQKLESLAPWQLWWHDKLWTGELIDPTLGQKPGFAHPDAGRINEGWLNGEIEVSKALLYEDYSAAMRRMNVRHTLTDSVLGRKLSDLLPENYPVETRHLTTVRVWEDGLPSEKSQRVRCYLLPSLDACRRQFDQVLRQTTDWQEVEPMPTMANGASLETVAQLELDAKIPF